MLSVRGFVSLGELTPEDVDVQVLHGKIDSNDILTDDHGQGPAPSPTPTTAAATASTATSRLDRGGPFGYTVRVIPRNDLLTSIAELGVVAIA